MRKVLTTCLWLTCSALFLRTANANPYIDLNLGANTTDNSMAYSADGGYIFNKYVGLEGGSNWKW